MELKIRNFDDITVSTKTFIVMTNVIVDIKELFKRLPVAEYILIPKRRGRKKKVEVPNPNEHLTDGAIITLEMGSEFRGTLLKKKSKEAKKYFRNSLTIVMFMDNKKINFKISRNGKFQMTGCKFDYQAENCIKHIWKLIEPHKDIYLLGNEHFYAVFIPSMRNIDFSLGFLIDREKLDEFFNSNTDYTSMLETSIGYTGVNIKMPIKIPITELKLKKLVYGDNDWKSIEYIEYMEYLNTMKDKEKTKKLEKERFNSFLVFQSGKVIMSSMCVEFAKDSYYEFMDIVSKNYKKFIEKI